ncbi:MAG: hypothetical protein ABI362_12145 [Chthoniobacterales bacterium]
MSNRLLLILAAVIVVVAVGVGIFNFRNAAFGRASSDEFYGKQLAEPPDNHSPSPEALESARHYLQSAALNYRMALCLDDVKRVSEEERSIAQRKIDPKPKFDPSKPFKIISTPTPQNTAAATPIDLDLLKKLHLEPFPDFNVETFLYYPGANAGFTFSLHNRSKAAMSDIGGRLLFYDRTGHLIDTYDFNHEGVIGAGLAVRVIGQVDSSVRDLNSPPNGGAFPREPAGKIEFQLLQYTPELQGSTNPH